MSLAITFYSLPAGKTSKCFKYLNVLLLIPVILLILEVWNFYFSMNANKRVHWKLWVFFFCHVLCVQGFIPNQSTLTTCHGGAAPFSQRSACKVAELQMAFIETFLFRREVIPLFILTFFQKTANCNWNQVAATC